MKILIDFSPILFFGAFKMFNILRRTGVLAMAATVAADGDCLRH